MQREIKFRAWNGTSMHNGIPLSQGVGETIVSSPKTINTFLDLSGVRKYEDGSAWELMQFTGLKDKNGKEIYEGDVVSYGSFKHVVEYGEFEDGEGAVAVGFSFAAPSTNRLEVVGNIYENPDLLKEAA